jgi:hypothetical protein
MGGIFDLADPKDLLAKLGRELDRLRADPDDVDHAFNFFTTAEHMLDWLYPGNAGDSQRKHLRSSEPILATVSHLASGAKHFDKLSSHHKSVHGTKREGGFWAKGFWAEPRLTISLSGAAANDLGATITAFALAEKVYAYWSVPRRVI